MKKWAFVALVLISLCANPALLLAQNKKAGKAAVSQPTDSDKTKQEKDVLIANINGLSNQEFRVAILQQIVNEELAKLRNLEAVFSDQYKLNVEKFRKGLYRYDDKLGKIVEQPAPVEKK